MRRHFVTLDVFTGRRYAGNPLAAVQVRTSSGWLSLARASYDYWIASSGAGAGPFTVRLTDIEGHQVTVSGITLSPGTVQSTGTWMYGGGTATTPSDSPPLLAATSAAPGASAPGSRRICALRSCVGSPTIRRRAARSQICQTAPARATGARESLQRT